MSETQFSMHRYNEDKKQPLLIIDIEHTKDFSRWQVCSPQNLKDYITDGYGWCCYGSGHNGNIGKPPQQRIEIIVKEIKDELKDKGFVNVEVVYNEVNEVGL